MSAGHLKHIALIRDMGGDDAYIHPGLSRVAQGGVGGHVDDQIGGGDVDVFPGLGDHVQIDRLAHGFPVQRRVRIGLDIAGPGAHGRGLRPEMAKLLLPAAAVVPHSEEHDRHRPYRVPLQQDGTVLPVAEALPLIDVFIRQVDPAGEAHLPVNDHQLPVVTVVQTQGHDRNEAVEYPALDAPGGQLLVVVPGEAEDTAHVVIDQPDLHALGGLLLQNVQDAVPKDAGLEDEVLQEDVPLCLLQLLQHPGKDQIAQGEVFRLCVGIGGAVGEALQIAGLPGSVLPQGEQVIGLEVLPQVFLRLLGHAAHPAADPLGDVPAAHQQIEDAAEYREGEDEQQPGDLIGGLDTAAQDQQGGDHADGDAAPVEAADIFGKNIDHDHQRDHLGQQGEGHKNGAVKQDIQDLFHRVHLLFWDVQVEGKRISPDGSGCSGSAHPPTE